MFQVGRRRRVILADLTQGAATNAAVLEVGLGAICVQGKIWGAVTNTTVAASYAAYPSFDGALGTGLNNASMVFNGSQTQRLDQTEIEAPFFMFYWPSITAATGFALPLPSDRFTLRITLAAGTNIIGATLDYWPWYGPYMVNNNASTPGMPTN